MDPKEEKRLLREAIRARLRTLPPKDRAAEGRTLSRTLKKLLPHDRAAIAAYMPLADEPDIRSLLLELLQEGARLFLPRFEGGRMVFRETKALEGLAPGLFNIPEPPPGAPLLDPLTLSHALIPARAYDRRGNRLGRGNGGYDVWIAAQKKANPATLFWGVAFECQIVQRLPMESHDAVVHAVITARGMI